MKLNVRRVMSKHVLVKKLSAIYEDVKPVKDPKTGKDVPRKIIGYNVFAEGISIDQIKAFKEYGKTQIQRSQIVGDVTLLYLTSDQSRKPAEMMINENILVFGERIKSINFSEVEEE